MTDKKSPAQDQKPPTPRPKTTTPNPSNFEKRGGVPWPFATRKTKRAS